LKAEKSAKEKQLQQSVVQVESSNDQLQQVQLDKF